MEITYTNVRNPRYSDAGNASINVEVTFDGLPEIQGMESINGTEVTFCAMATDREAHGREIFANALAGKYGAIAAYVKA